MMYYQINEESAKRAHEMNSMRGYANGETTAAYRQKVDGAAAVAEAQKTKHPDLAGEIDYLLDKYARKLAEWYNRDSQIESYCPSVLISGASNFPVAKKEKQNRMRDKHYEEYQAIERILYKIERIGTGGIKSGDAKAIEKLEIKIERLEDLQEQMKAVNAYYRKNKTLDGCPDLTAEQIEEMKADINRSWRSNPKPFEGYELTNNNANIRRLKERLDELKTTKEQGTKETEIDGIDGLKLIENVDEMRIQLIFDGKPDAETRTILKGWGFKWSPRNMAWQRMLNDNGKYAAGKVIEELKKQAG